MADGGNPNNDEVSDLSHITVTIIIIIKTI